jgi:hypothetical protein
MFFPLCFSNHFILLFMLILSYLYDLFYLKFFCCEFLVFHQYMVFLLCFFSLLVSFFVFSSHYKGCVFPPPPISPYCYYLEVVFHTHATTRLFFILLVRALALCFDLLIICCKKTFTPLYNKGHVLKNVTKLLWNVSPTSLVVIEDQANTNFDIAHLYVELKIVLSITRRVSSTHLTVLSSFSFPF